jgi:8-oxo-dGTP pyrophosphatase MutT (NUDIX family)
MSATAMYSPNAFKSLCSRYSRKYSTTHKQTKQIYNKYNQSHQVHTQLPNNRDEVPIYGAIFKSKNGKYALVKGRETGKWSFPKGHSMIHEQPIDCVLREVGEEIGLDTLPIPNKFSKLYIGEYYYFEIDDEFPLKTRDNLEVVETCWATLDEMKKMKINVDVSAFIRKQ